MKRILTFCTIILMLISSFGCILGLDLDPMSLEEMTAATEIITQDVYWTRFGKTYHMFEDCQALQGSTVFTGTVEDAFDAGHKYLCRFCASRAGIDNTEIRIEEE
ncbi:MAG: hypothetical protein IKZ44_04005 [Clostridia bacterium]|nr:hypothetical protein [Clostridia bacterium]